MKMGDILRVTVIWELRVVVLPYAWRKKNVTRWREQKLICCGWLDAKRELKTAKKYKFWISSRHFHELLLFSACPPISKRMAGERSKKTSQLLPFAAPLLPHTHTAYFCGNSLLNLWTDNNNYREKKVKRFLFKTTKKINRQKRGWPGSVTELCKSKNIDIIFFDVSANQKQASGNLLSWMGMSYEKLDF